MVHATNQRHTWSLNLQSSSNPSDDVVIWLCEGSDGGWEVERETDPFGDVSIIVLPTLDNPTMPTFMLYEKDGVARVATIRHDTWEDERTFSSCKQAANAIIALTTSLSMAA